MPDSRLDGDAAAVEAQSLPDQRDRLHRRARTFVLEHDHAGILRRALRDGEEGAHAQRLQLAPAHDRHVECVALCDVTRHIRHEIRCAHVAGHHRQTARDVVPGTDRQPRRQRLFRARHVIDVNRGRGQRRAALVGRRRRLEVCILPRSQAQSDRNVFELRRRRRARIPHEGADAHPVCAPGRQRRRPPQRGAAIGALAQTDQEHADRALGAAGQVQDFVAPSAEIAALERPGQCAAQRGIHGGEHRGDCCTLRQPEHQ